MIAALFVQEGGVYFGLPGVDPWPASRDARLYPGPWPIVAHPPCSRWAMPLAKVNETRYGHKVGDDDGCFLAALTAVRRWGGVLEHPAHSAAWGAFSLRRPSFGCWAPDAETGWVCQVAQSAYGHKARKRTWLYVVGPRPRDLDWSEPRPRAVTSWLQRTKTDLPRLSKREASRTPPLFRDTLIQIAATSMPAA